MALTKEQVIRNALVKLDPADDENWTEAGLPAIKPVVAATGIEDLKRSEITDAAPLFTRENRSFDPPAEQQEDPDDETAPPEVAPKLDEDAIVAAAEKVQRLTRELEAAKARLKEAQEEHAALLPKNMSYYDHQRNQEGIQAYLARQNQEREERAANNAAMQKLLAEHGVDPKAVMGGKAPIDRAFQRRTSRGTTRPTRRVAT